jgi:hypothetical protein
MSETRETQRDETFLRLLAEHQKLTAACERVYRENLNVSVGSVHPHVSDAIREMTSVMESSTAPGKLRVRRLIGVN